MKKSRFEMIREVFILLLLTVFLFFAASCKKSPQPPRGTSAKPSQTAPVNKGEPNAPAVKPKEPTESNPPATSSKAGVEMVPIVIELPKPMFVGTPQPTQVPNLEKPLGKASRAFPCSGWNKERRPWKESHLQR